ncbi:zf-HC2 domain-containing protein [Granulicella sp. dw_53]|uniref:anti-sigma factor family protein n=1 Tax=Granulicella sp. dw_53 TaxID=2719792 RepID=UPI001BD356AE|nr:zf-HC2 domain-containing protein [Granulicella sp. dw_53]
MTERQTQIPNSLTSRCNSIRAFFSAYLDGAVSGRRMQTIATHLETCDSCHQEFEAMRDMQRSLAELGTLKPPADLGMKLRLAISHERARRKAGLFDGFSLKWQNAIRPVLIQASAGFAGTIVLLGGILLLLGMVAAPEPVMANDEPLGAMTVPHYRYSAALPRPIINSHDATIIVEAYVNSEGRVYDYKIVSGPEDTAVQIQIVDQLLLSVFEPARVFGAPIRGRAVVTFSGVSVQG